MKDGKASRGGDYAREIAIEAARERAYDAIATLAGVRGWWTTRVSGSEEPGGTIRLEFEGLDEHIIMHVEEATRPKSIHWTCVEHTELDDWNATKIAFEIAPRGAEGCELSFRHLGLTPKFECYEMCEGGWDHFLASLVAYVDDGQGTPFGMPELRPSRRKTT